MSNVIKFPKPFKLSEVKYGEPTPNNVILFPRCPTTRFFLRMAFRKKRLLSLKR